jgi:hypothetical protein
MVRRDRLDFKKISTPFRSLRSAIFLARCYGIDICDKLKGDVYEWADVDGLWNNRALYGPES